MRVLCGNGVRVQLRVEVAAEVAVEVTLAVRGRSYIEVASFFTPLRLC